MLVKVRSSAQQPIREHSCLHKGNKAEPTLDAGADLNAITGNPRKKGVVSYYGF